MKIWFFIFVKKTESKDRFETIGLGSNDETEDKRGVPHEEYGLDTCKLHLLILHTNLNNILQIQIV